MDWLFRELCNAVYVAHRVNKVCGLGQVHSSVMCKVNNVCVLGYIHSGLIISKPLWCSQCGLWFKTHPQCTDNSEMLVVSHVVNRVRVGTRPHWTDDGKMFTMVYIHQYVYVVHSDWVSGTLNRGKFSKPVALRWGCVGSWAWITDRVIMGWRRAVTGKGNWEVAVFQEYRIIKYIKKCLLGVRDRG